MGKSPKEYCLPCALRGPGLQVFSSSPCHYFALCPWSPCDPASLRTEYMRSQWGYELEKPNLAGSFVSSPAGPASISLMDSFVQPQPGSRKGQYLFTFFFHYLGFTNVHPYIYLEALSIRKSMLAHPCCHNKVPKGARSIMSCLVP